MPDCPWCDARDSLEVEYIEMGVRFCVCSVCSQRSRVDHAGHIYRQERLSAIDVSGNMIDYDY